MAKAPGYRSSEGLSFELSGVFVLVYEVDEKTDDGSWPPAMRRSTAARAVDFKTCRGTSAACGLLQTASPIVTTASRIIITIITITTNAGALLPKRPSRCLA